MISLTFGLFNQVSGLGPLGPLVLVAADAFLRIKFKIYNTVLRTAEKSNMAIIDTVQLQ